MIEPEHENTAPNLKYTIDLTLYDLPVFGPDGKTYQRGLRRAIFEILAASVHLTNSKLKGFNLQQELMAHHCACKVGTIKQAADILVEWGYIEMVRNYSVGRNCRRYIATQDIPGVKIKYTRGQKKVSPRNNIININNINRVTSSSKEKKEVSLDKKKIDTKMNKTKNSIITEEAKNSTEYGI